MVSGRKKLKKKGDMEIFSGELWGLLELKLGKQPVIIALSGPFGAGKTTFTKYLASHAGVTDTIVSPTFILSWEYDTRLPQLSLVHIDAWRIEKEEELLRLGWMEFLERKSLVVVEWADRVAQTIEKAQEQAVVYRINLSYGKNKDERMIEWEGMV